MSLQLARIAQAHRSVGPVLSYADTVLADNPLLFYMLDDTGATANNLGSVTSLPLTYSSSGCTQNQSTGRGGLPAGVLLDGAAGCLLSAATPTFQTGMNAFSLEYWLNPTSLPGTTRLSDSGNRISASPGADGSVTAIAWANSGLSSPAGTLVVGGTVPGLADHLGYSWDGVSTEYWYKNGVLVATRGAGYANNTNNTPYVIGRYSGGGYFYPGLMAGHALYGTALSAARWLAHYNAGK